MKLISQEALNKLNYLISNSTANIPLWQVVPILDMLQTLEDSNEDELKAMLEVKDKKIAELENEIESMVEPAQNFVEAALESAEEYEKARKEEYTKEELIQYLEENYPQGRIQEKGKYQVTISNEQDVDYHFLSTGWIYRLNDYRKSELDDIFK